MGHVVAKRSLLVGHTVDRYYRCVAPERVLTRCRWPAPRFAPSGEPSLVILTAAAVPRTALPAAGVQPQWQEAAGDETHASPAPPDPTLPKPRPAP